MTRKTQTVDTHTHTWLAWRGGEINFAFARLGCELGVAELMQDAVAGVQRCRETSLGGEAVARIKTSGPLTRARPPTQVFLQV